MQSDEDLYLKCARRLGVTIDEELYEKSLDALFADPLKQQAVRLITALQGLDNGLACAVFVRIFAQSVWEQGYRAAPKLEFLLQEGAEG